VAAQPDGATVVRHLARLTAAYPAFRFSRELLGWKGGRWVPNAATTPQAGCASSSPPT